MALALIASFSCYTIPSTLVGGCSFFIIHHYFLQDYHITQESLRGTSNPVTTSKWHGKSIKLQKFQGSLKEYADDLSSLDSILDSIAENPDGRCQWEKIPHMVVALYKQKIIFNKHKINNQLNSIEGLAKMSPKYCGQSQSFFRSYM